MRTLRKLLKLKPFLLTAMFFAGLLTIIAVKAVHNGLAPEFELGPISDGSDNANIVDDVCAGS